MKRLSLLPLVLSGQLYGRPSHESLLKAFPNYVHRQGRGMTHVAVVKPIVAQLVKQNFIAVKIAADGIELIQTVYCQEKGAFAELVAMCTVGHVAYGTNGKDNPGHTYRLQLRDHIAPKTHYFGEREPAPLKHAGWQLVAIGHHTVTHLWCSIGGYKTEGISSAESDNNGGMLCQEVVGLHYRIVAAVQTLHLIGMRETAMMKP